MHDYQDYNDIQFLKTNYMQVFTEIKPLLTAHSQLAEKMARAERDYLVAKSQITLRLKADGMSVTLIPSIAQGQASDKRLAWKLAEGKFHSNKEQIKMKQTQLDAFRSLLSVAKSEMEIR